MRAEARHQRDHDEHEADEIHHSEGRDARHDPEDEHRSEDGAGDAQQRRTQGLGLPDRREHEDGRDQERPRELLRVVEDPVGRDDQQNGDHDRVRHRLLARVRRRLRQVPLAQQQRDDDRGDESADEEDDRHPQEVGGVVAIHDRLSGPGRWIDQRPRNHHGHHQRGLLQSDARHPTHHQGQQRHQGGAGDRGGPCDDRERCHQAHDERDDDREAPSSASGGGDARDRRQRCPRRGPLYLTCPKPGDHDHHQRGSQRDPGDGKCDLEPASQHALFALGGRHA